MGIRSLSTASISTGTKRSKVWDQSAVVNSNSYESIATVTVGSTAQSSISFTSIPSTYKHLQIRVLAQASLSSRLRFRFNSDSGTNYSNHFLMGTGSSAISGAGTNEVYLAGGYTNANANIFTPNVIDILDYANTSKYKTSRILTGYNFNSTSGDEVLFWSGNWRSTSAVSNITMFFDNSANITQYSSFALYGIKG